MSSIIIKTFKFKILKKYVKYYQLSHFEQEMMFCCLKKYNFYFEIKYIEKEYLLTLLLLLFVQCYFIADMCPANNSEHSI